MSRRHGTYSCYTNGKCRCDACSAVSREYNRRRRPPKPSPYPSPEVRADAIDTLVRTRDYALAAETAGVTVAAVRKWARAARCVPAQRVKPAEHGEFLRYLRGCRCAACRAANAARNAALKAARVARGIPVDVAHGTTSTYGNWDCRCDACCAAQSLANRRRYESRSKSSDGPTPSGLSGSAVAHPPRRVDGAPEQASGAPSLNERNER